MNVHVKISPKGVGVVATAVAALALPLSSLASASPNPPDAQGLPAASHGHDQAKQVTRYVDANGNTIEVVDPGQSQYVPDLAHASKRDLAKAQRLLDGANKFCRTHDAKQLEKRWHVGGMGMGMGMSGMSPMTGMKGMKGMKGMSGMHGMASMRQGSKVMAPTHYFNPKPSQGLHPMHPTAALIFNGRVGGVMLNGEPLAHLGSIPRAHTHEKMLSHPIEMVHVYCTHSLKTAFTPNRTLGVKAPMIALRNKIRPAVMDLNPRQLREIDAMVKKFKHHSAGMRLPAMKHAGQLAKGGPKPALQAMRVEIRSSLMVLNVHQLRTIWKTMESYS